ncbi:MAG: hypothetical protein Ct9H300mP23_07520 [Nitrospinota bacterium]|nr:MAG: hypothetical protein Ct9H300mP23_07520 [Nitrospinota bacterium]
MIYAGIASILPVQILLQPRDYLSTYILFGSMALAILGLLWVGPELNTPAWRGAMSEGKGPVWPMLFVLVACGAVSGFHSLVAGGTTSKQLAMKCRERSSATVVCSLRELLLLSQFVSRRRAILGSTSGRWN